MLGYVIINISDDYDSLHYKLNKFYLKKDNLIVYCKDFLIFDEFAECLWQYDYLQGTKRFFLIDYDTKIYKENNKFIAANINSIKEINVARYINTKADTIDWNYVATNEKLSTEFLNEHFENFKWHWNYITIYQNLETDFLEKHWNDPRLNWNNIAINQNLPIGFLEKHLYDAKWDWHYIDQNKKVSEQN